MPYAEKHYRWEWRLRSSPEQFWPFIANTNRFNRDTGLPVVESRPNEQPLSAARRRLRFFRLGMPVEWIEEPFEWVSPYRFGVVRRYLAGPVAEMRVLAEVTPLPGGGSRFVYQVWVRARNLLGVIAIPIQIGLISAYSFGAAARKYDAYAGNPAASIEESARNKIGPQGRRHLALARAGLSQQGAAPDLVENLVSVVQNADDLSLSRLRPYVLADYWGAARPVVLDLCLLAAHSGLLELRWDIMCPLCRVSKAGGANINTLLGLAHCDTCNIDFTANIERSVELSFRPNAAIRRIDARDYCLAGPQVTPHVVLQQLLEPGERRTLEISLPAGRYRARALEMRGGQHFIAAPAGAASLTLRAAETGWPAEEPRLSTRPTMFLENGAGEDRLILIEQTAWSDQAVPAADVLPRPAFREHFASQGLTPGEEVSVGALTVAVFSPGQGLRPADGAGPPQAPAWIDTVREAVEFEQGHVARVSAGEAMAVFARPLSALRAAVNLLADLARQGKALRPAIGLHCGPCVATLLQNRLEYLGYTPALAGRLAAHAPAGQILLTAPVRADAQTEKYLGKLDDFVALSPFLGVLKGFDTQGFDAWQLTLRDLDGSERVTVYRL